MFGKKASNNPTTPSSTPTSPMDQEKRRFTDNLPNGMSNFGSAITLHGNLKGNENVELSGTIEGNVELEATLLVCKSGKIVGDVVVQNLIVDGEVHGDVVAKQKIELRDACRVHGNLQAAGIAIAEGAFFQGTVKMLGNSAPKSNEPLTFSEKRAEV
jgi:cytoskeletal protein CcmA (bactofilin family)